MFPHAKVNLGLDIVARRADGYHEVVTAMWPISWADILELTPAEWATELVCTGRRVDCPPEKNLVMKAFRLMEQRVGALPPTRIQLHKVIPDGAGLGGGSADAAMTLRGLNDLWQLDLSVEELAQMASQLGADCPFFIYDRPMLCTGIGTEMTPIDIDLQGRRIAVVKPECSVSTAEAYAGVTPQQPAEALAERLARGVEQWQGSVVNAFETSVFARRPEIGAIKRQLLQMGAVYASMSGSGSAVFGLFDTDKMSAERLAEAFPGCLTCFCD
jgi:4-diphosphocytidyl-2-C-methyl-D-erythritol kinase